MRTFGSGCPEKSVLPLRIIPRQTLPHARNRKSVSIKQRSQRESREPSEGNHLPLGGDHWTHGNTPARPRTLVCRQLRLQRLGLWDTQLYGTFDSKMKALSAAEFEPATIVWLAAPLSLRIRRDCLPLAADKADRDQVAVIRVVQRAVEAD